MVNSVINKTVTVGCHYRRTNLGGHADELAETTDDKKKHSILQHAQ